MEGKATDEIDASKLRQGEAHAFSQWMQIHQSRIYSFISRRLGHVADAMDVVQETFLGAHKSRSKIPEQTDQQSRWLLGIARHKVADSVLKRKQRQQREIRLPEVLIAPEDPAQVAEDNQRHHRVHKAIQTIPEPYQETLLLARVDGLTYEEVATLLEIPLGTVRSRIAKARKLLMAALKTSKEGLREL